MLILRLTASLSMASLAGAIAPFGLAGNALSQPTLQRQTSPILVSQASMGTVLPDTSQTIAQTTTDQSTGTTSYTSTPGSTLQSPGASLSSPGATQPSPGSTLQSPGASLSPPGATQTTNGQSTGASQATSSDTTGSTGTTQGITGSTQTAVNGQSIGPSLPSSTKTPGAEQTFVNGQSTGTTQVAPPVTAIPAGATGTQVSPTSVLYPPQLIQGSGVAPAPTQSPAGTVPIQPQSAPSTAATRTVAPSSQLSPTQLQPGQGALDAALQQATCAQNWRQAIQVVNTAIAATPTNQAGYRSQLVAYRNRLQTLQAKGVQAPNWARQCRGGAVATQ